jgi:hypothetical protein
VKDVLRRFWGHVDVRSDGECWLWQSTIDKRGYGAFQIRSGKNVRAHRFAFEIATMAPIPEGMLALHSCDTPACVNPSHLRAGTQSENLRDCIARGRHPNSLRTHCRRGHLYDHANTHYVSPGWRRCRTCDRILTRMRRMAAA